MTRAGDDGYLDWFRETTGCDPHPWQLELGSDPHCQDRLIRVPTGFGKTAGVVLAWLYHRVLQGNADWPRRLIFVLPMRVLVEQCERAIRGWIESAAPEGKVGVHVLMGGSDPGEWALFPQQSAVLLGTQDMLLSRALNRGYAAPRGRWPVDFGLLHQDALWILDEVQLMDVGLITSAQLAAFREEDERERCLARPARSWWMSATLQPAWLETVDTRERLVSLRKEMLSIPPGKRTGGLWGIEKTLERRPDVEGPGQVAERVKALHEPGTLTLLVLNRVDTALSVFDAMGRMFSEGRGRSRRRRSDAPDLRLAHSRFRGSEREAWDFLGRSDLPPEGRILVATQVVEAGVDLSARLLLTELAPWPSLVQRMGRCARYEGESGRVVVFGGVPESAKGALPYDLEALVAAAEAVDQLAGQGVDPLALEVFEESLDVARLQRLYPYHPVHVIRRKDLDDLFDTSPDLSGLDVDVSRFVRSGEERDVLLFWRSAEPRAGRLALAEPPSRRELCPVPVHAVRDWLGKDSNASARVLRFDYLENEWIRLRRADLARLNPGTTLLVLADVGGYDPDRGWDPRARGPVREVLPEVASPFDRAAGAEDDDSLSAFPWKTIATHGREAAEEASALARELGLEESLARVLHLAGRWHDSGKAHPVFQNAIAEEARQAGGRLAARRDLAKAPAAAWRRPPYPDRPGFRHELVSTLALLDLLWRIDPDHPALLGPHRELLRALGEEPEAAADPLPPSHPLAAELRALSAEELDLLLWLVCSHHGKVRCVLASTPRDQESGHGGIHGVVEGDAVAPFPVCDAYGEPQEVPEVHLCLEPATMGVGARFGASWSERVAGLLTRHGPFQLAFLEALFRSADVAASRLATEDPIA